MTGPTRFPDLNQLLADFAAELRTALAGSFRGAYLVGSFAVGGADEHSDVDFLVAIERYQSDEELAALQAMHKRLYAREVAWAQHLEGSYAPTDQLRRPDPSRSPWWFLDNGADELVLDNHCNTAVMRWTLREHGIVLAGPDARTLVEPVPAGALRAEALATMREYADWAPEPTKSGPISRWKQPYLVLTFCRLLHTIAEGRVGSKQEAGQWAIRELDPRWADLIQCALDDRPDPWGRVYQPADPEAIERTVAFVDDAMKTVAR